MKFLPFLLGVLPWVFFSSNAQAAFLKTDGAVARGDFNGDGNLETAASSPESDCGKGSVYVSATSGSVVEWNRDTSGVLGAAACNDFFGASLVAANLNGDNYDDLVIGIPGADDSGDSASGAIHVLYGSSTGLTATGDQLIHQDTAGIGGAAEDDDQFGEVLAAGDFDCDGFDDLVIGVPGEAIGSKTEAGAVQVIYGSAAGLTTADDVYYQGSGGVNGVTESYDRFGEAVVVANFDQDTSSGLDCNDLAVGAPDEHIGSTADAGYVYVMYGGTTGLSTSSDLSLHQNSSGVADTAEANDRFGARLRAGDVDGDGYPDLGVISPGDSCLSGHGSGLHLFLGGSGGITTTGNYLTCNSYRCLISEEEDTYGCRSDSPPVFASTTADVINLFVGDDVAWANDGDDVLVGELGDDVLFGGDDDDTIDPGPGIDLAFGGEGDDTFVIDMDCEVLAGEVVDGGPGADTIESHLTRSELLALGLEIRSVETFATIAEDVDGSCSPYPFEEGSFIRPKIKLAWSDLPDTDSTFTTTTGELDLVLTNNHGTALDVELRVFLKVRGYVLPLSNTSITVAADDKHTHEIDLNDFVPAGTSTSSITSAQKQIPTSASLVVRGEITNSSDYAGHTSAPIVYGHLNTTDAAVLYREQAMFDTYHGGNLISWRGGGNAPTSPVRVSVAAVVPSSQ